MSALVVAVCCTPGCAVGIRGTPTEVTVNSAVLQGGLASTAGGAVSYHFEYGQGDDLRPAPVRTRELAASGTEAVSEPVEALEPGRIYGYRVCAEDSDNAGQPFCSPLRTFSTDEPIGQDYVIASFNSVVDFTIDVRSDPSGASPDGEVTVSEGRLGSESANVTCLAVLGSRATIGVEFSAATGSGFFFLEDGPIGPDRFASAPLAAGQSLTDCPAGPATLEPVSSGYISVHDAVSAAR